MNADALVSDSELVGAYASQGLVINGIAGRPEPLEGQFMQQHIRGLRMAVEFALGRLAPAKPIAVLSPAVQRTHDVQARLEAAGYVVVVAHQPAAHVIVRNAPPTLEANDDEPVRLGRTRSDLRHEQLLGHEAWREGDTIEGFELDDSALPTLDHGLCWEPIKGRDAWVVLKDLSLIGG